MKLKSELISNIFIILLWILVGLAVMDFIATIVFVTNPDFFMAHVYSASGFVSLLLIPLYYLVIIVYLVWIYRIHMDLQALIYDYPRSPGMALACMMIPFFNLYGLPSTYLKMAHYFSRTLIVQTNGRVIRILAILLILCVMVSAFMNRAISRSGFEPSGTDWIIAIGSKLTLFVIFLAISILVTGGLKRLQSRMSEPLPAETTLTS